MYLSNTIGPTILDLIDLNLKMVNVECIAEFDQQPDLNLNLTYNSTL